VNDGDYDGTFIHRVIPGVIIQGGGFAYEAGEYVRVPQDGPVLNDPCISNTRGTVAMAKMPGDPNSATNQWFINLQDNLGLDSAEEGFTVFGRVLNEDGMAVANAIASSPITDGRFSLNSPLRNTFSQLPLLEPLIEAPGGYDCFPLDDPFNDVGALVDLEVTGFETDPDTGTLFYLVLRDCREVPDDPTCSPDRAVARFNLNTGTVISNPDGTIDLFALTCEEFATSEAVLSARRGELAPQVPDRLITVTRVPEPSRRLLLVVALAGLGWLRRAAGPGSNRLRRT
jgi:cyclophilin family peptidyl-prolyl cis-trans isomerase